MLLGHASCFSRYRVVSTRPLLVLCRPRLVLLPATSRVAVGHFSCSSVTPRVSLVIVSCLLVHFSCCVGHASCYCRPLLVLLLAMSRVSVGQFPFFLVTSRVSLVIVSCFCWPIPVLLGHVSCFSGYRLVFLLATSRASWSRLVFLWLSSRVSVGHFSCSSVTPRVSLVIVSCLLVHFSYFCRPCLVCLSATSRSSWSRLVFLWLSSRVSVGHFSCFSVTSRVSLVIVSCCYRPPIVVLSSVFVFVSYFPRLVWLGQLSCLAF